MVEPNSKSDAGSKPAMSTLQKVRIIAITVCTVLALVIIVQNRGTVEAHLLLATFTLPLAILLFGSLVIGFALGLVFRTRLFRRTKV